MSIDMSQLVTDVASRMWKEQNGAMTLPLEEQDPMVQWGMKARYLPVVNTIVPIVEDAAVRAAQQKVLEMIASGHDKGYSATEILLNLELAFM